MQRHSMLTPNLDINRKSPKFQGVLQARVHFTASQVWRYSRDRPVKKHTMFEIKGQRTRRVSSLGNRQMLRPQ
jgi:hypothetical protein